jgi:hypothetical protein
MPEELETILRLVAEGKLSPDEASPIIDALTRAERATEPPPRRDRFDRRMERAGRRIARAHRRMDDAFRHADERLDAALEGVEGERGRQLRIRVTERGRQVVNLRIPIGFVDAALGFVPGLGGDQSERIRDAVRSGAVGPIIDVEDPDGDGVLISVE